MADTSGQHLQSLLPWAANILRVTESLRLKLGNGHDSSVTDILGDARTQDLVHYFVDRGEVASIPDSAQAQMLSMREPILTYTDKLRVKWAERAQSFKLPAALVAMHQQAARAGADPSQMGLLVIEAIAHAAMHIYLLEKAQRVSLLLTDEETKGQKRMAILEHELKGLMYAQEFANPVYLARVERELRDVLDLYRSMLDGGAQEADLLRQQQVRLLQWAAEITALQDRIEQHMGNIQVHHRAVRHLVARHITPEALLDGCTVAFRDAMDRTAELTGSNINQVAVVVARMAQHEMAEQMLYAHGGLPAEACFEQSHGYTFAQVGKAIMAVNAFIEAGQTMALPEAEAAMVRDIGARPFDDCTPAEFAEGANMMVDAVAAMKGEAVERLDAVAVDKSIIEEDFASIDRKMHDLEFTDNESMGLDVAKGVDDAARFGVASRKSMFEAPHVEDEDDLDDMFDLDSDDEDTHDRDNGDAHVHFDNGP